MKIFKIKTLFIGTLLLLPLLNKAQAPAVSEASSKQQKMENKIVIGKVFVPKNSLEEFRSQNTTGKFLKTLPGPPVITGSTWVCTAGGGIVLDISFTAAGSGIVYNDAYFGLCPDSSATCYPVRMYLIDNNAPAANTVMFGSNCYSVRLLSGTVNSGVVEVSINSAACQAGLSAYASIRHYWPAPRFTIKFLLMNQCGQRSLPLIF